ncbi:MAG: hypothetical protein IPJ07_18020 [Acidobacteria bacterium]|nr:hypothetical protein [Acidobacteriota bacterium]
MNTSMSPIVLKMRSIGVREDEEEWIGHRSGHIGMLQLALNPRRRPHRPIHTTLTTTTLHLRPSRCAAER